MSSPVIGQPMLNFKFAEFPTPYSPERLQDDLSAGVGSILAGVGSNFRLNIDTANAFIVLGHKDAVYNAYSAAADTGNIRTPAIGLTANGIAMGFNDVDGSWKNSVAIDATTGNVTILGTLAANSVVSASAYLGSTPVSTVVNNAAYGNAAYASLSTKIDKNASYVLEASSEFKTSGYDGGNGMLFSNNGIIARAGGVNKFVIASNGDATFSGSLSAASGSFAGNVSTTGTVQATGTISGVNACFYANPSGANTHGIVAYGTSSLYGVYGFASSVAGGTGAGVCGTKSTSNGCGVLGSATGTGSIGVTGTSSLSHGVHGSTATAGGAGVVGTNSAAGPAMYCAGIKTWGSYNIAAPNGSTSNFLRADGSWAAPTVSNADTVDGYHAGNSSGQVAVSNGVMCTNLNAQMLGGYSEGSFARFVAFATGNLVGSVNYTLTITLGGYQIRIPCVYT